MAHLPWLANQSEHLGFVSSYHLMHSHNQSFNNNISFYYFKVGVYFEFKLAVEELKYVNVLSLSHAPVGWLLFLAECQRCLLLFVA